MTGTDLVVAKVRNRFASELLPDVTNKIFYATAYRNMNRSKSGIIAEVYTSANEYEEVLFDDSYDVMSFFDVGENIEVVQNEAITTREINALFAMNLTNCYPDITYRAEELAHKDVIDALNKELGNVSVNSILSGVNAYRDLYTDKLKSYNMHPWHTFSVNFTARIDYTCDVVYPSQQTVLIQEFDYPFPIIFS